jgi:uncharacterized protein (TIGR02145 family)
MMKKRFFYFVPALVLMSAASVSGQVLIGGSANDGPHAAAVLDLASGGQTNKGLLLPNVALTGDATYFVLKPDADSPERLMAAGMIVYNTAATLKGRGVYVWDGNSWTSLNNTSCPKTITDIENNEYFVGDFGDAGCWMTQNLRSTYNDIIDSADLTESSTNDDPYGLYYYYPKGDRNILDPGQHPEYGLFYNWTAAANNGWTAEPDAEHVQGICPRGWHVPSKAEWVNLATEIANDANQRYSTYQGTGEAGTKMKHYVSNKGESDGESHPRDKNGFDALLISYDIEESVEARFWTGELSTSSYTTAESISLEYGQGSMIDSSDLRENKLSVRCKRDY